LDREKLTVNLSTRHWIFLGLFVVIVAAMLLNLSLDTIPSTETTKFHSFLDSLPAGSTVIVSFDHEASALPEIRPLAVAVLRHLFAHDHKLIGVALLAEGTGIGNQLMEDIAGEYDKSYGSDFVYLGYQPQPIAAIISMGESLKKTYPSDYFARPYDSLPLLAAVTNLSQVAAVVSIADGNLTTHWIEYGHARFGVPVVGAVTGAMMTSYDPYLASGQLAAMVGGLRGAAEYETLIGHRGSGARGMLAQTIGHLYVIAMILAGNIIYVVARRRGRGGR
jgi:hypothetical protein